MEQVPANAGPLLFVGNHTLYGALDVPHLFLALQEQKGLWLRGLGDHAHFQVPVWRRFVRDWGVVDGTPENTAALFRAGHSVLVFPGGSREVARRKGEGHQLIWKQRAGFARLAAAHGVPIVPFAAMGASDAWDIVYDADDLLASPVGPLLQAAQRAVGLPLDALPPVVRGLGGTPLPRPERLYFWFGPPIHPPAPDAGADAVWAFREQVRQAVEGGLDTLDAHRAQDPSRRVEDRLVSGFRDFLWRRFPPSGG
jgi:1-acyl-sn-glycerol-3-phosphate acyltransferase